MDTSISYSASVFILIATSTYIVRVCVLQTAVPLQLKIRNLTGQFENFVWAINFFNQR